jgi:hypothetical protein
MIHRLFISFVVSHQNEVLSIALVGLRGEWYYAELVDARTHAQDAVVLSNMRKIPGTRFLRKHALSSDVKKWMGFCGADGAQLICTPADRALFEKLLASEPSSHATPAGVRWELPLFDACVQEQLTAFCQNSRIEAPPFETHALMKALLMSSMDPDAPQMHNTQHLETLLGGRGARSYAVWMRRKMQEHMESVGQGSQGNQGNQGGQSGHLQLSI